MTKRKKPEDLLKRGVPLKYQDPEEFRAIVERYFKSISYERPLMVRRDQSGMYTQEEYKAMSKEERRELVPVFDRNGAPMVELVWVSQPFIMDLQLELGISHQCWAEYAERPEFGEIVTHARKICENWAIKETARREGSTNGLQFLLRCIYGHKDVQNIKVETTAKLEDDFE